MNRKITKCYGKYLNEWSFPNQGKIRFLHKGKTGVGGTTICIDKALEEKRLVVVAMPTVNGVISKHKQFGSKILAVHGNYPVEYCKEVFDKGYGVIVCTYDKLTCIHQSFVAQMNNADLVLDEYHCIARDSSFRGVMTYIFDKILPHVDEDKNTMFNSITLMSATPDEYLYKCINKAYENSIEEICYEWDSYNKLVCMESSGQLKTFIKGLSLHEEYKHKNYYIFLNSVQNIRELIMKLEIPVQDVNIVASPNNKEGLQTIGLTDASLNGKKYTFITSSGFEGADNLDKDALSLICINPNSPTSLFDQQTIKQICGRARNTDIATILLWGKSYDASKKNKELWWKDKNVKYGELMHLHTMLDQGKLPEVSDTDMERKLVKIKGAWTVNPIYNCECLRYIEAYKNSDTFKQYVDYILNSGNIEVSIADDDVSELFRKKKKADEQNESRAEKKEASICKTFKEEVIKYLKTIPEDEDMTLEAFQNTELRKELLHFELIHKAYVSHGKEIFETTGFNPRLLNDVLKQNLEELKVGRTYKTNDIVAHITKYNLIHCGRPPLSTQQVHQSLKELGYMFDFKKTKENCKYTIIGKRVRNDSSEANTLYRKITSQLDVYTRTIMQGSTPSNKCPRMKRSTLSNIDIRWHEDKHKNYIVSGCYPKTSKTVYRLETNFDAVSSLFVDFDDGDYPEEIYEKLKSFWGNNVFFWWYKSHSWSDEHPKWRMIIPLSREIQLYKVGEEFSQTSGGTRCTRALKAFQRYLFQDSDTNCQLWFYAPEGEIYSMGTPAALDADFVEQYIDKYISNSFQQDFEKWVKDNLKTQSTGSDEYKKKIVHSCEEALANYINMNCSDGDRDTKCFWVACRAKENGLDMDKISSLITDEDNRLKFEEKAYR